MKTASVYRLPLLALMATLAAPALGAAQDPKFNNGVFIATAQGPTELVGYAERRTNGNLVMVRGSLEEVPRADTIISILVTVPHWKPAGIIIATERAFHDDYYERVTLAFAQTSLSVTAIGLKVSDLEQRDQIEKHLRKVKASADAPGYCFVILQLDRVNRYYPIRLDRAER